MWESHLYVAVGTALDDPVGEVGDIPKAVKFGTAFAGASLGALDGPRAAVKGIEVRDYDWGCGEGLGEVDARYEGCDES
jgi:hypothetical protein